jgi:hypothetical protein
MSTFQSVVEQLHVFGGVGGLSGEEVEEVGNVDEFAAVHQIDEVEAVRHSDSLQADHPLHPARDRSDGFVVSFSYFGGCALLTCSLLRVALP